MAKELKRDDVAKMRAMGAERQENRGRDWSRYNPIYEARVMGHCVDTAISLESLRRDCINGKNGQAHPVIVWELNTQTGHRRPIDRWNLTRTA